MSQIFIFTVCGKDIILRNATLTAEVALIDEFFNDVNAAELDLIQEVCNCLKHREHNLFNAFHDTIELHLYYFQWLQHL